MRRSGLTSPTNGGNCPSNAPRAPGEARISSTPPSKIWKGCLDKHLREYRYSKEVKFSLRFGPKRFKKRMKILSTLYKKQRVGKDILTFVNSISVAEFDKLFFHLKKLRVRELSLRKVTADLPGGFPTVTQEIRLERKHKRHARQRKHKSPVNNSDWVDFGKTIPKKISKKSKLDYQRKLFNYEQNLRLSEEKKASSEYNRNLLLRKRFLEGNYFPYPNSGGSGEKPLSLEQSKSLDKLVKNNWEFPGQWKLSINVSKTKPLEGIPEWKFPGTFDPEWDHKITASDLKFYKYRIWEPMFDWYTGRKPASSWDELVSSLGPLKNDQLDHVQKHVEFLKDSGMTPEDALGFLREDLKRLRNNPTIWIATADGGYRQGNLVYDDSIIDLDDVSSDEETPPQEIGDGPIIDDVD